MSVTKRTPYGEACRRKRVRIDNIIAYVYP
jgi:hypothetical protein